MANLAIILAVVLVVVIVIICASNRNSPTW